MKRPFTTTAVVALAAAAIASSAFAGAAKKVTYTANFKGNAVTKVSGNTVTYASNGSGLQQAVGKGLVGSKAAKLVAGGTADKTGAADSGCAPFKGPATIKSAAGTLKATVLPTSRGCAASADDQDNITLQGTVKVTNGTGKFKGAKGTLRFSGHFNNGTGAFTVKVFKGVLTTA